MTNLSQLTGFRPPAVLVAVEPLGGSPVHTLPFKPGMSNLKQLRSEVTEVEMSLG